MLNAGQKEHSAILSTFIKLTFVVKIFVLSISEWPLKYVIEVHEGIITETEIPSNISLLGRIRLCPKYHSGCNDIHVHLYTYKYTDI